MQTHTADHQGPASPGQFPQTRWSLIADAADRTEPGNLKALDELLSLYRPVLKVHAIAHLRIPEDQADDLVQNFILEKVLEKNLLTRADRTKGRFRNFLAKVFSRYVISQIRRAQAQKRGPAESRILNLDVNPDQLACESEIEAGFNAVWARQVLAQALARMEKECKTSRRNDLWDVFMGRIVNPAIDDLPPLSYEDFIEKYGCRSPTQASNLLISAKRMFSRILRDVVGDTVSSPHQIDEEIKALRKILSDLGAGSPSERRSKG